MTLNLTITPKLEAKLRERAAVTGKDVLTVAQEAIEEQLASSDDTAATQDPAKIPTDEWILRLRRFAARHRPLPFEADDSRESIYAGRGE